MPLRKHQSVKQAIQGNARMKINISRYGVPFDAKMFQLVDFWRDIFWLVQISAVAIPGTLMIGQGSTG
jgi:hypothetical protein